MRYILRGSLWGIKSELGEGGGGGIWERLREVGGVHCDEYGRLVVRVSGEKEEEGLRLMGGGRQGGKRGCGGRTTMVQNTQSGNVSTGPLACSLVCLRCSIIHLFSCSALLSFVNALAHPVIHTLLISWESESLNPGISGFSEP